MQFSFLAVVFYAINYPVKRIGWFKTTPDDSKKGTEAEKGQCFQNPVYDVSEVMKQEPAYSQDNPVYQLTDDPDRDI